VTGPVGPAVADLMTQTTSTAKKKQSGDNLLTLQLDPDPHSTQNLNPDLHLPKDWLRIRYVSDDRGSKIRTFHNKNQPFKTETGILCCP
jgi:hypothetical protein